MEYAKKDSGSKFHEHFGDLHYNGHAYWEITANDNLSTHVMSPSSTLATPRKP